MHYLFNLAGCAGFNLCLFRPFATMVHNFGFKVFFSASFNIFVMEANRKKL